MKIVHIAPCAPYNEGWSYQENLLPKYHLKLGHDVTLIITNYKHEKNGLVLVDICDRMQDDGVRLIRLKSDFKSGKRWNIITARMYGLFSVLNDLRPDYIFFHGLVSASILDVIRYKKRINPNCYIVQDNHADVNNSYSNKNNLKYYIIQFYYRLLSKLTINYVDKVYGVTPGRQLYAEKKYKIPKYKTDILIMGADDEYMKLEYSQNYRTEIRKKFNVSESDFLIISGGKLDEKKNIDMLMTVCGELKERNVRLLLFGNIDKKIEEEFNFLLDKYDNITYIGWIESKNCYQYFYASDLVCFPGLHSVLWEQACASKIPCLFAKRDGLSHVNNGGNSDFFFPINKEVLKNKIEELIYTDKYYKMLSVAKSSKTDIYLYSNIAKKSIEDVVI